MRKLTQYEKEAIHALACQHDKATSANQKFCIPTTESMKRACQFFLRRGYAIRGEFTSGQVGYMITDKGYNVALDYQEQLDAKPAEPGPQEGAE